MVAQVQYADHERLIHHTARKVQRRLWSAGARSVDVQEIVQELSVAWCKARDGFDPGQNVKFSTYLVRTMYNHINAWVKDELGEAHLAAVKLDQPSCDDGDNYHEFIGDNALEPAVDTIIREDLRELVYDSLSARARQFIQWLENPPVELLQTLRAMWARAEFAKQRGLPAPPVPGRITSSMVFQLMACPPYERRTIYAEIAQVTKEMQAI
jgi:RNA polymerase sigma factor (sigma-70 family)